MKDLKLITGAFLIVILWFLIAFNPIIISACTSNWWFILLYFTSFIQLTIGIALTEFISEIFELQNVTKILLHNSK